MADLTAAKKASINKMNQIAKKHGLGDLLSPCVIVAGRFSTAAGSATQTITATGTVAGDTVLVTVAVNGGVPRTITTAVAATDTITVVMSGDPSTDHSLNYAVLRTV